MKGHKAHHHAHGGDIHHAVKGHSMMHKRHHRATGGGAHQEHASKAHESADHGDDEAEEDLRSKPEPRTNAKHIDSEAEAMHAKRGGKAKKKHVGHVDGHKAHHHAGRKARATGGAAENNPFTTANKGTPAKGRHLEKESMGRD